MKEIDIYLDEIHSVALAVTNNGESISHNPYGEVVVDIERRIVMFSTHISEYNIKFDDIIIEHMAKKYINIKTNDND